MARTNNSFKMYSDPGHGWLAVRLTDLEDVGLTTESFSNYSYRKGKTVYLEEDCDADIFVRAWQKKFSAPIHLIEKFTNKRSPIRGYYCIRDFA